MSVALLWVELDTEDIVTCNGRHKLGAMNGDSDDVLVFLRDGNVGMDKVEACLLSDSLG